MLFQLWNSINSVFCFILYNSFSYHTVPPKNKMPNIKIQSILRNFDCYDIDIWNLTLDREPPCRTPDSFVYTYLEQM